jgi:hypothetical protein
LVIIIRGGAAVIVLTIIQGVDMYSRTMI